MGIAPQTSPDPDAIASGFRLALEAARAFEGATAPNPPVGCAILNAIGDVLAVAAHEKAGQGHAEARAIAQCRERGVIEAIHTLIVTLEPCNHFGRTPPCSQAIMETPAQHVWIGAEDPNDTVKGGGRQALVEAGIIVRSIAKLDHAEAAALAGCANRLIGPFAKRLRTGLPWITIKQALDATGSMIPPAGAKTFTSTTSLALAHRLRRRSDAILTGSGTILADAPLFTVRHVPDFAAKARHLVILDRRRRISADYLAASRQRGFLPVIAADLHTTLRHLGDIGALEVLVEAGPQVTASVRESGLWDEHIRITSIPGAEDGVEVIPNPSHTERT
ncbi:bifunctional diaminohydroxyphosphoribosylaminopyrimidine deaminase/5-amino-6-(5-phosphoribosylamino)uracil reductase RibD [Devosia elaeis]|uniref:Riboflavin biosynthesis protein RibD n=1 Tax=Devosia elaeis TaxID=1770058 RepID=A0A178HLQ1_9HYPH|nr:bifunctional diaminohydroxyphosphoribosylaminopyrimidine deaminase/5-amino-6-(5-phosphoribosylamino)uracil reductase RibD [Devosia elaeis]OAM73015.1 bifunctional diaminohydroxyphosphoribosylaminopyrimidine deaminase/5-amino-6-(5-phosphoribosylamino)uracil reductase [Devosia elaeis]